MGESDRWVARCPEAWAPEGTSWLHHSAAGRLLLTRLEASGRETAGELRDPYSEVYRLTRALVLRTRDEVQAAGSGFRLIVQPGQGDLRSVERGGAPYWSRLVEDLEAEGVAVTDLTPSLRAAGGSERSELFMPEGHWSPLGNRLVADELLVALPD